MEASGSARQENRGLADGLVVQFLPGLPGGLGLTFRQLPLYLIDQGLPSKETCMLFIAYKPDISAPAATAEQLMRYEHANRTVLIPMCICAFLTFISGVLICFALLDYHAYLGICAKFAGINMAVMLVLCTVEAYREFERGQLSVLDDNESIELAGLLSTAKNPDMLRFAAEVKEMQRFYRRSELQALRLHAKAAVDSEAALKARQFLYQ